MKTFSSCASRERINLTVGNLAVSSIKVTDSDLHNGNVIQALTYTYACTCVRAVIVERIIITKFMCTMKEKDRRIIQITNVMNPRLNKNMYYLHVVYIKLNFHGISEL